MPVVFKVLIAEGILVAEADLHRIDADDHDDLVQRFSQGGYEYAAAHSLFVFGDVEQNIFKKKIGAPSFHFLGGEPYPVENTECLRGGAREPFVVILHTFKHFPNDPIIIPKLHLLSDKLRQALVEKGKHVRCLFSFYD